MRIVLVFVLALLGVGAFAQEGSQYIGTKEGAVRVRGTLYADSGFYLPKRQLRSARIYDTGAVYYQLSDSSAYVWTGSQWNKIGSETTTAGNLINKSSGVFSFPGTWSADVSLDGAVSTNPTRSWIMQNLYQFKVTDGAMAIGMPGEASFSPYMGTKYSPNNDFDTAVSVRAIQTKVSGGNVVINGNTSIKVTGSPLTTSTDTTTYKPAAIASDGTLKRMASWPSASGAGGSQTLAQVLATGRTLPTNDSVGLSGKYFKFYGNTSNVQTEGLYLGKRQFDNTTNAGWYPLVIEPMSTDSRAPNWYWKLNQTVQTGTYPNNVMKYGWNPDLIQTNKMALWDAFESYYSPGGGTDSILERHFSIQGPGFGEVRLGSWTAYIRNGVLGENNTTNLFSNFDLRAETFNIYTTTNRTYASFSQNKTSRVAAFQLQSGNGTAFNLQVDSSQGLITFSQSGSPTPRIIDFFRDGNTRDVNMYGLKVSTLFGTQFEGYAGPDGDSTREFGGYSTKFKRGYFGTVGSAKQIVGHLAAWGNFTPSSEIINWTPYADNTSNFLKMYGVGGSGTKLTIQNNGAIGSATKSGYLSAIDLSESNTDTLLWPRWGQVLQKLAAVGGTTLYTGDGSVSGSRTVTLGTNTFTFSSNSASKFHIASNGKVSIGSATNNGYDFNVNGQLGVTGSGFDFAINGSSSFYWGTTGDNNVRWIGNSKEFRQIISSSDISFSPYTDNTLPYRIKNFAGTTLQEIDFANSLFKVNAIPYRTSNDTKVLVRGSSDSAFRQLSFTDLSTAMGTDTMYAKRGVTVSADSIVLDNTTETITSGTTTTIANATHVVIVDPASALASHTITLPAAPYDKQEVAIYFGGTVAGNATVVTTLTISANTGQALMQKAAPSTALGGDCFIYKYVSSNAKWYRKQ